MTLRSYNFLAVFVAVLLTFFPYQLVEAQGHTTQNSLSFILLSALQIYCAIFIWIKYKQASSDSLKVFFQLFSFAVLVAFANNLFTLINDSPLPLFANDFLSLISYFLIILAIETNPHLSTTPLNKYINGRVPAVFFIVTMFCYFVLLPLEFSPDAYYTAIPSSYFHMTITFLMCYRLSVNVLRSNQNKWAYFYAILAIAAFSLLMQNINAYMLRTGDESIPNYITTVLSFFPYLMLIIACGLLLPHHEVSKEVKTSHIEILTYMLALTAITIHLAGIELDLRYIIKHSGQSLVVVSWCLFTFIYIYYVENRKRKTYSKLKSQYVDQGHNIEILNKQNVKLHKALLHSEEKAIVNVSNNAILTTSTSGEILSSNPAAIQMFQCLEHELKGKNINTLFSESDKMHHFFNFKSNVFSLQRKELGISVECTALRSDGEEFPAQAELQWADRENHPIVVITFINLTARKLAEKQTLDLKDQFIANISHEFRTPLTIINGILERYSLSAKDDKQLNEITTAKRNGLRLVRMVEQLLELSRITDNPSLFLSTYRLKTLLSMPIDSFQKLANQNNLSLHFDIPENLWIECDAQAFEKIVFNLLSNAIKYTPSGGQITVNAFLENENDTITLAVADTGIGINQKSQDIIFERFQRVEDDKNKGIFGVGIGLSLVNELVKAHHWRINVISEKDKGSKFSLVIPAAQPSLKEIELPQGMSHEEVSSLLVEQGPKAESINEHSQKVVLIIEDNMDMQSHIKQVVETNHHCILAASGEIGLTLAQEYVPDLIICDIMLTGIDGFGVLESLKNNDITAHIPIILLTARSDLESKLKGFNLQADDYLSKPFNQKELLTRIDNLIQNRFLLQEKYVQQFEHQKKRALVDENIDSTLLKTSSDMPQPLNEKFLEKLSNVLAKLYTEPELDIKVLASELAVSERQLQRKIKVLLGTTPNNYIKAFRIKKAEELLKNGEQVGRVALDVGFSSQTYFGRCFKEINNCTPKQFQSKHIEN